MLSERDRYILKLLLHMAVNEETQDDFHTVDELAQSAEIPEAYLGKIVGFLGELGYLETRKGPKGGVRLRDNPDEILMKKLLNDIETLEHDTGGDGCCVPKNFQNCPVSYWIEEFKKHVLKKDTLEDLAQQLQPV
ncbi:MAG: Rrf2 family transcriptional regulator [bacterium]